MSEKAGSVAKDRLDSLKDVGLPAQLGSLGQSLWHVGVEEEQLGTVLFLVQFYGHCGVVGCRESM